jgi:hypothetical protein
VTPKKLPDASYLNFLNNLPLTKSKKNARNTMGTATDKGNQKLAQTSQAEIISYKLQAKGLKGQVG